MNALRNKYLRWVECFGKHDLSGLCNIARKSGAQIIAAMKPGMVTNNTIGVYATPQQMKQIDAAWRADGHRVWNRRRGVEGGTRWPISLDIPRRKWADKQVKP